MEKATSLPGSSNVSNLFSFFAKTKAGLMGRFVPGWSSNKIDEMLFTPRAADIKTAHLPRNINQSTVKTRDGDVQVYQIGKGPAVVFVHGWGGGAHQFFPLMCGLAQCGFTAIAFDQLGHGLSDRMPATLPQSVATANHIFQTVQNSDEGLCAIVGHSTGCITIASARPALVKDRPLFMISPVFNYKLFVLKKLVKLKLPANQVKEYANNFAATYRNDYQKFELERNLAKYGDYTLIAHDESDTISAVSDSERFCSTYPLTRLLVTKNADHFRVITSETVWQELKVHLNYDDTTINFTAEVINQ